MMNTPTRRNSTPSERLNHLWVSDTHPNLPTSFWPMSATKSKARESPIAYAIKSTSPFAKLCGKTVARITKYVGEQEEKTGPRDAPITMSPQKLSFLTPSARRVLDFLLMTRLSFNAPRSQSVGKNVMSPKKIRMVPE